MMNLSSGDMLVVVHAFDRYVDKVRAEAKGKPLDSDSHLRLIKVCGIATELRKEYFARRGQ